MFENWDADGLSSLDEVNNCIVFLADTECYGEKLWPQTQLWQSHGYGNTE